MKRVLGDGWFQMFASIAGLSVMIMAFDRLAPKPVLPEPPIAVYSAPVAPAAAPVSTPVSAPSPAAPASSPAPISSLYRSPAPAAAPTTPASRAEASRAEAASRLSPENYVRASPDQAKNMSGGAGAPGNMGASFPIFKIAPKTPGRWIVSNQEGPDVDSPSIMRVIFSASDGDVVLIRPGMYLEPLEVIRKNLTFRGLGKRPEEVLITSPNPAAVLNIFHSKIVLENLRIEPEKGFSATAAAVYLASGQLVVRNAVARSRGAAIQAALGMGVPTTVDVTSSRLDGAYADILVRGTASVSVKNTDFTNPRQPIVVWRDTTVRLDSCRFPKDPELRLYAYEGSFISIAQATPPVTSKRSAADMSADMAKFGPGATYPQTGRARAGRTSGFLRDIFRPGRRPGDLN